MYFPTAVFRKDFLTAKRLNGTTGVTDKDRLKSHLRCVEAGPQSIRHAAIIDSWSRNEDSKLSVHLL